MLREKNWKYANNAIRKYENVDWQQFHVVSKKKLFPHWIQSKTKKANKVNLIKTIIYTLYSLQ